MFSVGQLVSSILAILLFLPPLVPPKDLFCRQAADHTICVNFLKRSAKRYWEYRAAVKIDGILSPIEVYDCRERIKILKNGREIPFTTNGAGEIICRQFRR